MNFANFPGYVSKFLKQVFPEALSKLYDFISVQFFSPFGFCFKVINLSNRIPSETISTSGITVGSDVTVSTVGTVCRIGSVIRG